MLGIRIHTRDGSASKWLELGSISISPEKMRDKPKSKDYSTGLKPSFSPLKFFFFYLTIFSAAFAAVLHKAYPLKTKFGDNLFFSYSFSINTTLSLFWLKVCERRAA